MEEKANFILDQDLGFVIAPGSQEMLDRIFRKSGATMVILESVLNRIKRLLAQDEIIKASGNKTYEYKPDSRPRRWIYISFLLEFVFFALNLIDYYLINSYILTSIGLVFLFPSLIIQFLFIYKNGKITKNRQKPRIVHDEAKLENIQNALEEILPERNRRLKAYGLELEVLPGTILELRFNRSILLKS